jgi:hypothetical protein
MKKINSILLIVLLIAIFQSCKKTDETTPTGDNNPSQEEYVKCKIDGVDFLSKDDVLFNHAKIISLGGLTVYQLRGADDATEAIVLSLYDFEGVGLYDVSNPDKESNCQWLTVGPYATYDCNQKNAIAGKVSGKIEVTFNSSERIEGTFEFTAINGENETDRVTITEGEFRLNYK